MTDFNVTEHIKSIAANRTLKDSFMSQIKIQKRPQRISVTDLLNLKTAFYRRKNPEIVPSLDRQQLMWAGTGFHEIFSSLVSKEQYIEQFVEADRIVGKIDIFETIPVEVKTTSNLSEEADLRLKRPSYLEQLGMYCCLTHTNEGRLIIYQRNTPLEISSPLTVYNVTFPDLNIINTEMINRRDLLEEALNSDNPAILPKCAWQEFRCDYASICDCSSSTLITAYEIANMVSSIKRDTNTEKILLSQIQEEQPREILRTNDIVFPRKAYFASITKLKTQMRIWWRRTF